MADKIIIKKDWNDTVIKLSLKAEGVSVESAEEDFAKRVAQIGEELAPRNLAWTFLPGTIKRIVKDVVNRSLRQALSEMKKETIRIV